MPQPAWIQELEVQAALLDAIGLGPEAVVVVHVGGAAGGPAGGADRFMAGPESLSDRARARLAIENDDRMRVHADPIDPMASRASCATRPPGCASTSCSRPRPRTSRCCACASGSGGVTCAPARPQRARRRPVPSSCPCGPTVRCDASG